MTPDESPEQAYFRQIEDTFIRLRGAPFLLSPSDWRLAQGWYEALIPVEVVCRALEELFDRRAQRGAEGKVQSLRYCAAAVEAAWRDRRELGVSQSGGERYAMDVPARLANLAEALPEKLPNREHWAGRIRGATGAAQEVEARLASLDRELIDAFAARLPATTASRLEASVEAALTALRDRLDPAVLGEDRQRLWRDQVRRHHRLPLLSLFSPDALDG